jgi:hypothetical protein
MRKAEQIGDNTNHFIKRRNNQQQQKQQQQQQQQQHILPAVNESVLADRQQRACGQEKALVEDERHQRELKILRLALLEGEKSFAYRMRMDETKKSD